MMTNRRRMGRERKVGRHEGRQEGNEHRHG